MHSTTRGPARSRLLLVEGVPGVGKTTLLDALLRRYVEERPPRQLRTLVHLTQAHTYGPLAAAEDAGTLTADAALAHLDCIVRGLEWAVAAVAPEPVPKLFALVDTLHVTQCHRPGVLRWADLAPLDSRLAAIDCRVVFLEASAAVLRERAVAGRAGTQFLEAHARRRWGPSDEDLHRGLLAEQAAIRRDLARSQMSVRVLDAGAPPERTVDAAYRFWLERP